MSTPSQVPSQVLSSQYSRYTWHADTLIEATKHLDGQWLNPNDELEKLTANVISTDTRSIQQGDVFLALSGDNFDGHDYAQMAVDKGAAALIVERALTLTQNIPQLKVNNSRLALGHLGAYRRQQHPNLKVIAITGSSGKTTVKEMLGSIFNRIAPTLVTRGNLNNDLGVPMMLLELADEHEYAILELGANHVGEIAYTAQLVQPDVACVLNIGTAHLGEFGGRDGICKAKAEIYQALAGDGVAILPEQDDYASQLRQIAYQHTQHVLSFGQSVHQSKASGDNVTASQVMLQALSSKFMLNVQSTAQRASYPVELSLAGEHNVLNALAVVACAMAVDVNIADIVTGLQQVQPPKGRLFSQMVGKHRLIDDTYNANPHSVRAGAEVVASQTGQKVVVLGDIGELGEAAHAEHYQLGADIANMKIQQLLTVGEFAKSTVDGANQVGGIHAQSFQDKAALSNYLQHFRAEHKEEDCTILFKGSRFMKMETLFNDAINEKS